MSIQPTPPPSGVWATAADKWAKMDPVFKSAITSVLLAAATWATAWAASHGLIQAADASTISTDIVTCGGVIIMLALGWLKTRAATPKAMIFSINHADNGVKVVSASNPASQVNGPLK